MSCSLTFISSYSDSKGVMVESPGSLGNQVEVVMVKVKGRALMKLVVIAF